MSGQKSVLILDLSIQYYGLLLNSIWCSRKDALSQMSQKRLQLVDLYPHICGYNFYYIDS